MFICFAPKLKLPPISKCAFDWKIKLSHFTFNAKAVYFILLCHISIIKTFCEFSRTNKRTIKVNFKCAITIFYRKSHFIVNSELLVAVKNGVSYEMNRFIVLFGFILTANAGENIVNSFHKMIFLFISFSRAKYNNK